MPLNVKPKMTSKIVNFDLESNRMTAARLAKLPAPILAVYEKSQAMLAKKLKTYFDGVDDSLFEMADKAHSNQEQNLFFDSMREIRVQRRGIEKRFAQGVDEAFAELIEALKEKSASAVQSFSADALSLVENDDLEEMVALDSSVAKANGIYGESVQHISLRMDSLLPTKVYQKNNPVGPEVLCDIFMHQVKRLDVEIKAKLILFKLFDRLVISNLEDMYATINDILIDNNILPSLSAASASRQARSPQSSQSVGINDNRTTAQDGDRQTNRVLSGPSVGMSDTSSQLSPEVVGALQQLFGNATSSAAQAQPVLDVLSHVQRLSTNQAPSLQAQGAGIDVKSLIAQVQAQNGQNSQIARADEEVINLVAMLFDFILDDKSLASPMRALIARLQIPITKVALLDKTFFTKNGHAARRLLNEMSKAALGWQKEDSLKKEDPLYSKMRQVVRTLLNDFNTNIEIFADLLADFTSFVEKEKKRSNVFEKRTLDAEDGKAKAEVARTTVALEIELRIVNSPLAQAVRAIINKVWNNYLFVTALKHGYDSAEWRAGIKTLEDLVWSVSPPKNDEERKGLIRLVPNLLKRLRVGFDAISYNPYDMSTLFKALEDVHLRCIRGVEVSRQAVCIDEQGQVVVAAPKQEINTAPTQTATTHASTTHTAATQTEAKPQANPVKSSPTTSNTSKVAPSKVAPSKSQQAVRPVQEETKTNAPTHPEFADQIAQVEQFVQGSWFEMVIDNKSITRCRLAAFIKPTGKYIFINRNGMKVAERTQLDLAKALKNRQLRALDSSVLFDRALETVVSGMRKKHR